MTYPPGVIFALAMHGLDLQDTTPREFIVLCPVCRQEFQIWIPQGWIVTKRAHSADGEASYANKTRTKFMFEFDVECPNSHKLHLDWDWKKQRGS